MTKPLKSLSILFILKKRTTTWGQQNPHSYHSSGLLNSATFVHQMLLENGVKSEMVHAYDGNDIDRLVVQHNPDIVVLEAVWCPPSKLSELVGLHRHKHRKWIVRNHSELPFLSLEGISMEWLMNYAAIPNVYVSCNSPVANKEIADLVHALKGVDKDRVLLLTNCYPSKVEVHHRKRKDKSEINVGCFGAIRPLKNHLQQAVASILFARSRGLSLNFHINSGRIENNADPILKSMRALFEGSAQFKLVEHPWMDRHEFLKLCAEMDIGLQVSFSETFNIVGADLVTQGTPIVGSNEIPWLPVSAHADPTSAHSIESRMQLALVSGHEPQLKGLRKYSDQSKKLWLRTLQAL